MKSKLEIYALSICFAAVVCLVISLGIGSYSLIQVNSPDLTMKSYKFNQFQTNKDYWSKHKPRCGDNYNKVEKPEEDELTKQRLMAFEAVKRGEAREGVQSLIKSTLFIIFSTLALFIHWTIAKRCRKS
ncbi:MAG: hypothetical protein COB30_017375 [Ectothiorhodospiraceae bacterium]|nr:hypothetical protein [Ectothiorhodospiraceae bacterium]